MIVISNYQWETELLWALIPKNQTPIINYRGMWDACDGEVSNSSEILCTINPSWLYSIAPNFEDLKNLNYYLRALFRCGDN
jgi:hypothetical protein